MSLTVDFLNFKYRRGENPVPLTNWFDVSSEIIAFVVSLSVDMVWWRGVVLCLNRTIEDSHIIVHRNYHLFLHDCIQQAVEVHEEAHHLPTHVQTHTHHVPSKLSSIVDFCWIVFTYIPPRNKVKLADEPDTHLGVNGALRRRSSQWPVRARVIGTSSCSHSFGIFQKLSRPQHS